jgi:hypothetical protein
MDTRPAEGMIEPQPKRRGCFFWGCLSVLLLLVAMLVLVVVLFFVARDRLTSPNPQPVPVYQSKPGQYEEVNARLKKFDAAAQADRPAQLELTADDLNTLLTNDPQLKKFAGKAFVRIEGQQVSLDLSIPLDELPVPFLHGRWLNGALSVEPSLRDGRLVLVPKRLIVNGEAISEEHLARIKPLEFIPKDTDKDLNELLKKAKSLEVKDGKIVVSR